MSDKDKGFTLHQGGLVGVAHSPEGLRALLGIDDNERREGYVVQDDGLVVVALSDDVRYGRDVVEGDEPLCDAQVMTIAEFNDACRVGAYTCDDGVGYYGTDAEEGDVIAPCGGFAVACAEYTHVWWYGK